MDSEEEDLVFFGTPIEREEEVSSRRKKAVAEASGHLRSLPSWKQEVRDEEGRRRFHGAFTGGFSAGYYNTVGSKEGWTPQSFTSSRKSRAEIKQQSISNFLDEDEKAELEGQSIGTSLQFDTFGFTAAEYARKEAGKEQKKRPSAIPGPVPDELVLPAAESIGVKLLMKMGWRRGRAIKDSHPNSLSDARREARRAVLAFASVDVKASNVADSEPVGGDLHSLIAQRVDDDYQTPQNTTIYVLNPKQDLHGLGYDPFKHAPEFREKKRSRLSGNQEPGNRKAASMKDSLFGVKSGKAAPGFGIGALEEFDSEDEDVYSSGYNFEETLVEEDEEPAKLDTKRKPRLGWKEQGVLPGFRVASESDYQPERFDPPVIPKDFVPHHKFPGPLERGKFDAPPPPEVPPPADNNLRLLIEGVATLVSRCGKLFEELSREKNQSNPLFGFLSGGKGHDYYERKLWEKCQNRNGSSKLSLDGKSSPSVQKMTAESRGKLLMEKPLERSLENKTSSSIPSRDFSHLQVNLSDTFTKPASFSELPEVAKTFKDDPAKQARFEQFLKEKYQGGLRSTDANASNNMSETARARERLDFEAAAEALEKGKWKDESKSLMLHVLDFSSSGGMQFTSRGLEQVKDTRAENVATKRMFPKREEFQWRPSPILCKRFDLIDPYMGKPPPAPRTRSKMDSLLFIKDSVSAAKSEDDVRTDNELPATQTFAENTIENVEEIKVENVERPVDLYKAIFSDDSEDEVEESNTNKSGVAEKKIEAASTTLNRLIAGDFLESLGKELGLEVPPDTPYPANKAKAPEKETHDAAAGNAKVVSAQNKSSCTPVGEASITREGSRWQETAQEGKSPNSEAIPSSALSNNRHTKEDGLLRNRSDNLDEMVREDRKVESPSRQHDNLDRSESSDDESSGKRSRRHRYSSSDSYSDSSSDDRDRDASRSKGRRKRSARGKSSSSRKRSKHHKHRSRDSPSRSSHYDYEKRRAESHKDKRKRRD